MENAPKAQEDVPDLAQEVVSPPAAAAAGPDPELVRRVLAGEATFGQLAGVSDEDYDALAAIGYELFNAGKLDEAIQIFEALELMDPTRPFVHSVLGALYMREGNLELALLELDAALEADADDVTARVNRGELLLRLGRFEEAAEDLRTAIRQDAEGRDPMAMRARALVMIAAELLQKVEPVRDAIGDPPR